MPSFASLIQNLFELIDGLEATGRMTTSEMLGYRATVRDIYSWYSHLLEEPEVEDED